MAKIQELMARKRQLKAVMRMMESDASFDTEEGRMYASLLVKLVVVEMHIEAQEKEKIAHI
ncbi:hypothetical protein [Paenibacillus puerhi]|uniref:hypothetical protein n=1 Tax=Paenibacillus puerhi TaxID=2692622 RepID=UPI00135B0792|nr:hypothetical protein [Paenibacillus puerhi]